MYAQRVTATSIAVSGTGNTATTIITVPDSFTPVSGCIYDILISAQVPVGTDGTIIAIANSAVSGNIMQQVNGNYARSRALGCRKVIRVQWLDDPVHFNLIGVRG